MIVMLVVLVPLSVVIEGLRMWWLQQAADIAEKLPPPDNQIARWYIRSDTSGLPMDMVSMGEEVLHLMRKRETAKAAGLFFGVPFIVVVLLVYPWLHRWVEILGIQ